MRKGIALALALAVAAPLGPARAEGFVYERMLVPMRDGVKLSVDVWRPDTTDVVPVILTLTPYHILYKALDPIETDLSMAISGQPALTFVPQGYAYALADVRGTYNSGGCWDYGGIKERQDGYDLVEALAAMPWSNGRVGMIGASYDGTTANAAAVENPPHLATIVPISAISRWWGYAYQQGARATTSGESADIDPPGDTPTDFMTAYGFIPPPDPERLMNIDQVAMRWNLCDRVRKALKGYDTQPDYDAFWIERDYLRLAHRVTAPALVAHGFLDFNVKTWEGTQWFQALPGEKMLVAGQWPHALPSCCEWTDLLNRWFERWLKGVPNGIESEPAVWLSQSFEDRQQPSFGDGPVSSFTLSGAPVTYLDDGSVTEVEMVRGRPTPRYIRVPLPGTDGIHVSGRPVLHLSASSSAPQTHFVAVLCDVAPNGSCAVLSRAFLNARYRAGLEHGVDLVPDERYTFDLEFIDKDKRLLPDHHLELLIASSSTTWVAPDTERALNTVYLEDSWLEVPTP